MPTKNEIWEKEQQLRQQIEEIEHPKRPDVPRMGGNVYEQVAQQRDEANVADFQTIERAAYQQDIQGRPQQPGYWENPQRVARYYLAMKAGEITQPAWLDKTGLDQTYKYLERKNEGKPWWEWTLAPNDPALPYIRGMATPPDEFLPDREKGQTGWSIAGLQGAEAQAGATTQASVPGSREVTPSIFYTPPGKPTDTVMGTGLTREVFEGLPTWKKAAKLTMTNPPSFGAGLGLVMAGPVGSALGALLGHLGQKANENPEALLSQFFNYLTTQVLDWGAEVPERVLGLLYQGYGEGIETLKRGGTFQESADAVANVLKDLGAAWKAAGLYYDVGGSIRFWDQPAGTMLDVNRFPLENAPVQMPIEEFGLPALNEARERIAKSLNGQSDETVQQIKDEIKERFGFEGMANDLAMHIVVDLYNVTPAAAFGLATDVMKASKISEIAKLASEAGAKGPAEGFKIWADLARKTPGNELSRLDRIIGGITVDEAGQASLKWVAKPQGTVGKVPVLSWLADMTPQTRAIEGTTILRDNLVDVLQDAADVDEVRKTVNIVSKVTPTDAAQIGAMKMGSAEAGIMPQLLKGDTAGFVDEMADAYKVSEGKRALVEKVATALDMTPQKLVDELADVRKADDAVSTLKQRLMTLADTGDAEAAKVLQAISDPADPLTGAKLYNVTSDFRNGNFAINFEDWKWKVIDSLTTRAEKAAVDLFGVKPPNVVVRFSNMVKSCMSLAFLSLSPTYLANNFKDNVMVTALSGLFDLQGATARQRFWNRFGEMTTRMKAGMGGLAEVGSGTPNIGEAVRAAMRPQKAGMIEKASDLFHAMGEKAGYATKMSQRVERWSSEIAATVGTQRTYRNLNKVGVGISRMDSVLETTLKNAGVDPKRLYRAVEGSLSDEEIKAGIFGDGYKLEKLDKAVDMLSKEDADYLKDLGVYDELAEKLKGVKTNTDVTRAFRDVRMSALRNMADQLLRDVKARTEAVFLRVKGEGLQAALEEFDRIWLDLNDFHMQHHTLMDEVYKIAGGMKKKEARAYKARMFEQSEHTWKLMQDLHAARVQGVLDALKESADSAAGAKAIEVLGLQRGTWSNFYNQRGKLWNLLFEGEDTPSSIIALKDELAKVGLTVDELAPDLKAEYAKKINDALNLEYRKALEMESGLQDELDAVFADVFGRQFQSADAAIAWRAGLKDLRQMMAEAMIYFRNGDASGLANFGETRMALKAAIDNITGGKNLSNMSFDERAAMWPKFKDEVYRPLIAQYMKENQVNAGKMAQTPVRPQPLPPERIVVPTKPITNKQAVLDLANRYGITSLTKGGLEPQVLYVIQKFYPDIKSLDDVTADMARDAIVKHWEERYPGKSIGDIEAWKVTEATQPQPAPSGIPFMLTNQMKADLNRLGLTSEQIRNMTPADAIKALDEAQPKAVGGIPTEITDGMRKKLTDLGYDERQISKMNPPEAQSVIDQNMAWRITDKTKRELRSTGYTDEQIRNMTPGEAWDIVNANNEPASVRLPLGTVEQFTPTPPMIDSKINDWATVISPALRDIERRMMFDTEAKAGGNLADEILQGVKKANPNLTASEAQAQANQILQRIKAWAGQAAKEQRQVKRASASIGTMLRDYALLNYDHRTNFDTLFGTVFPYQFWYSHNMLNWALRAIDRPSIYANYARLKGFQQAGGEREGIPTRLRGKIGIHLPFLKDWIGDVFIDPMNRLFTPMQFTRPIQQLAEQMNMQQRKAVSVLYDMAGANEITPEQAQEAIAAKNGDLWEKAMARAWDQIDKEIASPYDFITTMYSPSPVMDFIYNKMMGRDTKLFDSPIPPIALLQKATSAFGIGGPGGIQIGKSLGIPTVDRHADYRVDRMLASMTAQGEITPDEAKEAMIQRTGAAYDMAVRKVDILGLPQYLASPIGLDFFPEGEQTQRALRDEYDKMIEAWKNGDDEAFQKFNEAYPEYSAQQLAWISDPEERLRSYLRGEVWNNYYELPELHQKEALKQLGSLFSDAFINKETRDYDSIDTETLATWVRTLGGNAMDRGSQMNLNLSNEQITNMYQKYAEEKDLLFPNINEAYDNKDTATTGKYEDWRQRYMESHPTLAPYLISERSSLYGAPENVQVYVYKYRAELNKKYPGIYDKQDEYYAQATSAKKKAYLNEHPELLDFWDWRRQRAADMPEAMPYILSDETIKKAVLGEDYVAPQSTGSGQTITFAESKKPKPLSVIDYGSMDPALLRQVMGWALVGQTLSEGAKQELRRSWEKQGRPGKSFDDYLLVVKEGFGQ